MESTADSTFPRLLLEHARCAAIVRRPARRTSASGRPGPGAQVADEVRALACGLAAQGFRRGMHLAIIGDNRPRLYWSMIAAQALGGIPVPMYQDAPAAEFVYVLNDAEIVYAIVEDQEQVDKIARGEAAGADACSTSTTTIRAACATTKSVTSFDRLLEIGREFDRAHPGFFDAEVAKGRPDDVSIMLYTSGTTGKPKGVCQTHAAFIAAAQGRRGFDKL